MADLDPAPAAAAGGDSPRFRSGAVARMLRMPVATLRIWERRYRVAAPATTPSGHRLYSAAQVQRLALLKQLTDLGHAIGTVAALDVEQLHQVAATHASMLTGARPAPAAETSPWRVVVVGRALARRLQRPALASRLGRAVALVGPFDSLDDADAARDGQCAQLLLLQSPGLQADLLPRLQAAAAAWPAQRIAVVYGYASAALAADFAAADVALLREPQAEPALADWLHELGQPPAGVVLPPPLPAGDAPPRRYDDATLADLAGLSSTIACECPQHIAELLMQLSHFEAYSAECADRSADDAALHRYLRQVAGNARALFETALQRVAIHEGLVLPG